MRVSRRRSRVRAGVSAVACAGLAASMALWGQGVAQAAPPEGAPAPFTAAPGEIAAGVPAVDRQEVSDMYDLTWDDFRPVPNTNWADPAVQPTVKRWKAAIVLVDYPDQPFQVTLPEGSNIWGNPGPQGHDIPRDQVPQFYKDFLNTPSEMNDYHTLNEYWMEDTGGRYGVELQAFGPYQLPFNQYQYQYDGMQSGGPAETKCPAALACGKSFRGDVAAAWKAATGMTPADFDNVFYVGAGQGESDTWLEFGQMMFKSRQDVPDAFGPPQAWKDAVKAATGTDAPNWAPTRYVDWTSWQAAATMWASASGNNSIEPESAGASVYAHEFSHNLKIGDNYGNPYANPALRDQSGAWDMMSRGTFNGPGGVHQRWHVPSVSGAVMGAQHMLRDKIFLKTVSPDAVVNLKRSDLATNGVAVATVTAREVQLPGRMSGVNVQLDGGDRSTCASQGAADDRLWMCDANSTRASNDSKGNYDNYTLEVVDRMGSDSFTSDAGVLMAKTKNSASPNKWTIDANPQDIDMVDYYDANGNPVKVTRGDHRQLNDALFHAGAGSGSQFEYADAANGLHFYVLDKHRDADGVLSYDVAVRSTDGAGSQERGVMLGAPAIASRTPGRVAACTVPLTNSGAAGPSEVFASDVYRVSATVTGAGWSVALPQQVVAAKAGASVPVTAFVARAPGAARQGTATITVTSESDASTSATVSCTVSAANT